MREGAKTAAKGDPRGKTVLIVDDDDSILNLLEILIRRDGFRIELARDGDQAMAKLARRPDALVLDIMLPGTTTGFEILRRLAKRREESPPVIVVTAFSHDREIQEVKRNPLVVLCLGKPINQKRLLGALHHVLGTAPRKELL